MLQTAKPKRWRLAKQRQIVETAIERLVSLLDEIDGDQRPDRVLAGRRAAVDIGRNLAAPIAEMGLPIGLETRTGDTPPSRRQRQRVAPPDILLTTPEQIALMLSHPDAGRLFGSLGMVIIDELHALAGSKRGDLLALDLARGATLQARRLPRGP